MDDHRREELGSAPRSCTSSPMAVVRTSVGNNSASSAPKPAVHPEPSPNVSIAPQNSAG